MAKDKKFRQSPSKEEKEIELIHSAVKLLIPHNNSYAKYYTDSSLHKAVRDGKLKSIKSLLKNKADIEARGVSGATLLQDAVTFGKIAVVELLLQSKALVDSRNGNGDTILQHAAGIGAVEEMQLLLRYKADISGKNTFYETPLHFAAFMGEDEAVSLLINSKVDVNCRSKDGSTPLHKAAIYGEVGTAELLISSKANLNAKNAKGETPVYKAIEARNIELTLTLLQFKADLIYQDILPPLIALLKDKSIPEKDSTLLKFAALQALGYTGTFDQSARLPEPPEETTKQAITERPTALVEERLSDKQFQETKSEDTFGSQEYSQNPLSIVMLGEFIECIRSDINLEFWQTG